MHFMKCILYGRQIKKDFDILNLNVIILLIHLTNRAVLNKLIGANYKLNDCVTQTLNITVKIILTDVAKYQLILKH